MHFAVIASVAVIIISSHATESLTPQRITRAMAKNNTGGNTQNIDSESGKDAKPKPLAKVSFIVRDDGRVAPDFWVWEVDELDRRKQWTVSGEDLVKRIMAIQPNNVRVISSAINVQIALAGLPLERQGPLLTAEDCRKIDLSAAPSSISTTDDSGKPKKPKNVAQIVFTVRDDGKIAGDFWVWEVDELGRRKKWTVNGEDCMKAIERVSPETLLDVARRFNVLVGLAGLPAENQGPRLTYSGGKLAILAEQPKLAAPAAASTAVEVGLPPALGK